MPALGVLLFSVNLYWPHWFPKYKPGTCVKDASTERVLRITGFDDRFRGGGVPATNVQTAQRVRFTESDPALSVIACPPGLLGPVF